MADAGRVGRVQTTHGSYVLDDDRSRLDLDVIWSFLSTDAYWGRWRDRADVEDQIASAWRVLAAYDDAGRLVAFARAVSDGVTTAYLGDVFVLRQHRGAGLGVALVAAMLHGPGAGLRWLLHTADAHGLYRRFGFAPPDSTMLEKPRPVTADGWQAQVDAVWASAADVDEATVVGRIEALTADRDTAAAAFERAGAYDFAGRESDAEPLYRAALAAGLDADRAARATVQLASTVRNLGRPEESLALLEADVPARFAEARAAFAALALLDAGRDREAALVALRALAGRLPVYGRAVAAYTNGLSSDS